MPYHVRITQKSDKSRDEVMLDLSREQLEERILKPYREGSLLVIGGKIIPPDDIDRIRINHTDKSADELLPEIRLQRRLGKGRTFLSDEWYVTERGQNVTDELITGPPGTEPITGSQHAKLLDSGPRVVFVVHGRNLVIRDAMFSFLRSIGLHPLEWIEAVMATGEASPYIGQILEEAFERAQAILVLMTPDDQGCVLEKFREQGDPPHETQFTPQARQNVIFEAGMAFGRCPQRTILVEVGTIRPFSDIAGRHVIKLNNSTQSRQALALRLQTAGCPVNLTGVDWHTAGNFDL